MAGNQAKSVFPTGYDSDVAREKNLDYTLKTYANPIRQNVGVKPYQQQYEEEERSVNGAHLYSPIFDKSL